MAQTKTRIPLYLGLTAAGGVGYYLYSAGGNPKVAEKQFEHDAAKLSAKMKGELPGREHEATKKGEELAVKAGATIDREVDYTRAKFTEAEKNAEKLAAEGRQKLDQVRKEAGKELHQTIDNFDKTVERKAVEAKNGISSWFGIGK
ncbi:MAG: hypothetical protein M1830_000017 [Pleopsidium flavum]|nr:MAG: hypothetical protein M1830_000017 [Pleopsidium flavum]